MAAKKNAKNGVSKKGNSPKTKDKKKGKKKKSNSKGHEFTPYEVSLIMTYLLVYSKAKSLAFFKKTYKDLKLDVKKETISLNSENKQNYEYIRALQEINDQLLGEITDNNLSKKMPLYMNMDDAFESTTRLNSESGEGKNDTSRHKKKTKSKESTTEKTIRNNYKFKYEEQIRNLEEQIQHRIEEIIQRRKYAKELDEENEKLDNELATIKSNLNNPLDGKLKELNETYKNLIEKNKEEINNITETNSRKAEISKRFAEEKMCNIEDGANMMQFESLSIKKQNVYLRNRYLHQLYYMILENIQQLHKNNIQLAKQNELLINRCIDIDFNGKYFNYDEDRLNEIRGESESLIPKNMYKDIDYKRVSTTLESIITGENNKLKNEEGSDFEEENEEEEEIKDEKQTISNISNEFQKVKEIFNLNSKSNISNINKEYTSDELKLTTNELLEQTKIDVDIIQEIENSYNNSKNNSNNNFNSMNNLNTNISIEDENKEIMNAMTPCDNNSNSSRVNITDDIDNENNDNEDKVNNINDITTMTNNNHMSSINKEDDIVNLIKNRGMKTSEYLNKNDSFHENKIDSSIYEKFKLNQYRYASSSDIHKSLNLNSDDEAMCTRLVKLTNYHLNNLEPYKSKKDKMDTYVIVKNLLKDVDKQYKKEQEDLKNKPKWVIKKPEDKRETFLIEKNETTNTNTKAKEFDNYYDFIDVNDITRVEDVNRLTELTIASYDYFKKTNDVFKKKVKVNHNTPNLRLYNKHYGQPVDFKKMNKKNNVEEAYNKKKKAFGNEYTRKMIEAEKEHEKEQLENKRRHFSKLYNTMPLQHPVMSISDKAIVQYNKRKKFNDDDIKRLLNYKTIKNRNFNQDLYSENHINTINEIIEKKGNKKDLLLYSYSNLFSDKNKILDEIDTNLYDKNGNYKNILSNNIDPYKKYCSLDPIIEFEINKALSNKSMKENNFFWFKSDKKPIENIDIMNEMISNSFIPDLMRNSKIQKPPYNTNDNLPNISKNSQSQ